MASQQAAGNDPPCTVEDLSRQVAEACHLWEGPQGVMGVLLALSQADRLSTKDLARQSSLPLPIVAAIKKELLKRGALSSGNPACLSDAARLLLADFWGGAKVRETVCPTCKGIGHSLPSDLAPLVDKLTPLLSRRPLVDVRLDQSHAEPLTSLLRAAYMTAKGGVLGRRILFLGDDDFVSLALLLWVRETVGPGALERLSVTVVDKDPRYLECLKETCAEENLDLQTVEHDLREPLPDSPGSFQTFATDPPYTLPGCRLFVSRALETLTKDGTGMGFLSFGQSRMDLLTEIQRSIAEMGLTILEIIPGFNSYLGGSILGSTSAMFLLAAPREAHTLFQGAYDGNLYTKDFRSTCREYTCVGCGVRIAVGKAERFETVEDLKAEGCSVCSGKKFKAYG